MRRLLFLTVVLFTCATSASAQNVSDRELMGLKGPVKTVRAKLPAVLKGAKRLSGGAGFDSETAFDREGRKVEASHYNSSDGKLWRRSVFTYDGAGGSTESSYDADGTLQRRTTRKEEFDRGRRTSRVVMTESGGAFYADYRRRLDSEGRQVEGSVYDREGRLRSRSTHRYGAGGAFEEFVHYDGAGAVLERHTRVPEGIRISTYGADGALLSTETRGREVCEESDAYGNCKRATAKWLVVKDGKVEEFARVFLHSYTYY